MAYSYGLHLGTKIGDGAFGDVYEGTDDVHGQVAVKILRQFPSESAADWLVRKESLLKEALNLKAAEHDNVVRVHSIVRHDSDDSLHLVAEFCDGGSLQVEYDRGPMALVRVKRVLTAICRGLECIHTRGMIHRDIKPANILCAGRSFKIGDFGLVSDLLLFGYASGQGYTDHLAPEVHSRRLTSAQSDVWALGMTIYRFLHGRRFYEERVAAYDIPSSVSNGGFAHRLPWLPHIPREWQKFIRKVMHDNTAQRFKSAFAVSQAVAALPTEPEWTCAYTPNLVTWRRQKNGRSLVVTWDIISERKHLWRAVSTGGSQSRRLAGTDVIVSGRTAMAGLESFFASSR